MIDLHCHLLPGIDDGAPNLETSLAMARLALADGTTVMACTPHILPGVYNNTGPAIHDAIHSLQKALDEARLFLTLVAGADIHVAPNLAAGLRSGQLPTINGSRYFLYEPPHNLLPPRFAEVTFNVMAAGFSPILTHPERLAWIEGHYQLIQKMAAGGVLMQITGGSLAGSFGRRARYWAERLLDDGLVHLVASDGHDLVKRPPSLLAARDIVVRRANDMVATSLFFTHPARILHDIARSDLLLPEPTGSQAKQADSVGRFL